MLRSGTMKIFVDRFYPDGHAIDEIHDGCTRHIGTRIRPWVAPRRTRDGFKVHIVVEPSTGLIAETRLTKATGSGIGDATVGAALIAEDATLAGERPSGAWPVTRAPRALQNSPCSAVY